MLPSTVNDVCSSVYTATRLETTTNPINSAPSKALKNNFIFCERKTLKERFEKFLIKLIIINDAIVFYETFRCVS